MGRVLRYRDCPDERQYRSLKGLGLVRRDGIRVLPRYRLYKDFLRDHL
jgi:hypothetical protein